MEYTYRAAWWRQTLEVVTWTLPKKKKEKTMEIKYTTLSFSLLKNKV